MAYILQLELNLKNANERIRQLESELRLARAESFIAEGCIPLQPLLNPEQFGMGDWE